MNAISIVTRVIAIVGAAAAAYFYFDLGNQLEETQQRLQSEEQRHQSTQNRLNTAQQELEEIGETLAALEANIEEAEGRVAVEQARAEELESELEETRATVAQAQSEREDYRQEATHYRDLYIAIRDDPETLMPGEDQELILSLQRELRRVEEELESTRNRLREFDGDPEPDRDVARTFETVRGKVADVDPAGGFVVLDIGTNHDLHRGDELMVHRNGSFIARVRVSRAEPAESIAQVLAGTAEAAIRRGDDVRITKVRIN